MRSPRTAALPRHGLLARTAVAMLVVGAALGCGGDTEIVTPAAAPASNNSAGSTPEPPTARVVLGTGDSAFTPLADGDSLELIAGIQGAFHVWVALVAYGFQGDRADFELKKELAGVALVPDSGSLRLRPHLDEAGAPSVDKAGEYAQEFSGWPAILDHGRCAHGEAIALDLTLSDRAGHSAQASGRFVLFVPEAYRSDDCITPAPH
jgi:hypothetical protein